MTMTSTNGYIAIIPPKNDKIEAKVEGGFAQAVQKKEVVFLDLVMDFFINENWVSPGYHQVIVAGDKVFSGWAKKIYSAGGQEFVLCPVSEIIGFKVVKEEEWTPPPVCR